MIRTRTTLALASLAAILALFIRIWEWDDTADLARLNRARSAFRFDPDRATRLSIRTDDYDITCERRGTAWYITSPFPARADSAALERLLGALSEIPRGEIVLPPRRAAAEHYAPYGLDIPRARILIAEGTRTNAFLIGRRSPLGDGVYIRRENAGGIARVSSAILDRLPTAPAALRSRALLAGAPGTVTRLELRSPAGYIQLVRSPLGDWRLHQPISARADPSAVAALLESLYACSITQFAQDNVADFTPYGLQDETTLSVILTTDLADPNQLLAFGDPLPAAPTLVYARLQAEPAVYAVPRATRNALTILPDDLRSRSLPPLDPAATRLIRLEDKNGAALELTRPNATAPWYITAPVKAPANPTAIDTILLAWNTAAIDEFLPPTPPTAPTTAKNARTLTIRQETPAGITQYVLYIAPDGRKNTRICLDGDSTPCHLPGRALLALPTDPLPYRSLAILSIPPSDVASLTLETPDLPAPLRFAPSPDSPTPPWAAAALHALAPLRATKILSTSFLPPTPPPPGTSRLIIRHKGTTALMTTLVLLPDATAYLVGNPLLFRLDPAPFLPTPTPPAKIPPQSPPATPSPPPSPPHPTP